MKPAPNNACSTTVNGGGQEEQAPSAAPSHTLAPIAHRKREKDRAPLQPIDQVSHRPLTAKESAGGRNSDCKRPGWTLDCKDLAQKLLFSEDSEEAGQAQKGLESGLPVATFSCVNVQPSQEIKNNCQAGSSGKRHSNANADPPLDASRDYILFSPTRLAAAMKKAKIQQSLQNQSASVLTVPSGLELSALSDTLSQPGEDIKNILPLTLSITIQGLNSVY